METKQKIIAFDFDGVIHKFSRGWENGKIYDIPIPGAKATLGKLVAKGFRIIIFTTRLNPKVNVDYKNQLKDLKSWLKKHDFKTNIHFHELTGRKPYANFYVDDKAITFKNWKQISLLFK